MNTEDCELEDALVQAYRAVIRAVRTRAENAETEGDLTAWRWRTQALLQEARENVTRMTPPRRHAAPDEP
jgi:metal-sulfur cluster biosynthetic enzyme